MDRLKILQDKKSEIEKVSAQIRADLAKILDEKSFVETSAFHFEEAGDAPCDSVVTGYGTICDLPVYFYAQNQSMARGGLSKTGADKIVKVMDLALKTGTPVVAFLNSEGAVWSEGVAPLSSYAKIMKKTAELSGKVMQVGVALGSCTGQMEFILAMQDFCFMTEDSVVSLTSPQVLLANEAPFAVAKEEFGGKMHAEETGICSRFVSKADLRKEISDLLEITLVSGKEENLDLSKNPKLCGASTREILSAIADDGFVLEVGEKFAPSIFTSFCYIGGIAVGVIGTDDTYLCGKMAKKATRFVRFCDMFNIAIITLCDCLGTKPRLDLEKGKRATDISSLLFAIASTENPKISLICKNAIGVGFSAFASKELGYDFVIASSEAFISPVPVGTGAEILFGDEVKASADPIAERKAIEQKYIDVAGDPIISAKQGEIDSVIDIGFAKAHILQALNTLIYKEGADRKLGNMPV